MLFRQLFERESSTYTYLVASRPGGEALLVDPVKEDLDKYLQLVRELDLRLVFAIDTHVHADHVTALGGLRDATACTTIMGAQSRAECVSRKVSDGERIVIDGLELRAMYTPGHTDDSYSFVMKDRVFTGDTLLIRGTGRTDFQNGDAAAQYESIFGRLLALPDETAVYPAHDYKGWTTSTIGEERANNPRLQVRSKAEYIEVMRNVKLANPRLMDVAVPANLACGTTRGDAR
jgi:sulfur dioxygenase